MDFSVQSGEFYFEHREKLRSDEPVQEERWRRRLHRHEGVYELLYVLSGEAGMEIEGRRYRLRPFNLAIVKPGEEHCSLSDCEGARDRYLVRFPASGISERMRETLDSLGSVYIIPGTRLSEEICRMDNYARDIDEAYLRDVLVHHLTVILGYAGNFVGMRQAAMHSNVSGEYIIGRINSSLTSIHCIEDISRLTHVSPSLIKKLVPQYIHQPVMQYVRTQKCILARSILEKGHAATLVCYQSGFKNYATFYRAYLKTFGEPPSTRERGEGGARRV